jgi:hypothetical protein
MAVARKRRGEKRMTGRRYRPWAAIALLVVLFVHSFIGGQIGVSAQAGPVRQVTFGQVSFGYDVALGLAAAKAVPGAESPMLGAYPGYTEVEFGNYPIYRQYGLPAQFRVMPVDEYAAVNAVAAQRLHVLKSLLAERPGLYDVYPPLRHTWNAGGGDSPYEGYRRNFPELPAYPVAHLFFSKMEYIETPHVVGFRLVSERVQNFVPIDTLELEYGFVGLTTDGKYYVAANFPVNANAGVEPLSPAAYNTVSREAGDAAIAGYNEAVVSVLNDLPSDQFSPSLDKLDGVLATLKVAPPVPPTRTPSPAKLTVLGADRTISNNSRWKQIAGRLRNDGGTTSYGYSATVTFRDQYQNVIKTYTASDTGFVLAPGETIPFQVTLDDVPREAKTYTHSVTSQNAPRAGVNTRALTVEGVGIKTTPVSSDRVDVALTGQVRNQAGRILSSPRLYVEFLDGAGAVVTVQKYVGATRDVQLNASVVRPGIVYNILDAFRVDTSVNSHYMLDGYTAPEITKRIVSARAFGFADE